MIYKLTNVDVKNSDWRTASVSGLDGQVADDVSINRTSKKGEVFPNFDTIANGVEVEGELWTSSAGKYYLFPPRAKKQFTPKPKPDFSKAIEKKAESVKIAQDNKYYDIKISSTFRAAVETAIAEYNKKTNDLSSVEELFNKWREFYWHNFDVAEDQYPPFK